MPLLQPVVTQIDAATLLVQWGPLNGGDQGDRCSIWAFPYLSWQLTGWEAGGVPGNPSVPVMADRSLTVLGSNDGSCYGPVFTLPVTDPVGMNARLKDPLRDGSGDQRFRFIKPVITGSVNPAGPDCQVLLFACRLYGPR